MRYYIVLAKEITIVDRFEVLIVLKQIPETVNFIAFFKQFINRTPTMENLSQVSSPNQTQQTQSAPNPSSSQRKGEDVINQEQIPDHFYDSDLASVNQKDFLSDNEPPKDQIQQRKLLYKQKMLHVYKTIIRLGHTIDKPARFDRIKLKFKQVPASQVVPKPLKKKVEQANEQTEESYPEYYSSFYLMDCEPIEYNLGKEHDQIQRLVTSMKKQETAVFQLQYLQTSKKSNIKVRTRVDVFVIAVQNWTTVIDMDCDGKYFKEVLQKGEGHNRINKHDQVSFSFQLKRGKQNILTQNYTVPAKMEQYFLDSKLNILWKLLNSMKSKQIVHIKLSDQLFRQSEGQKYQKIVQPDTVLSDDNWNVTIEVFFFHSIDDIFMDGRLLKKQLIKGVSTAKPQSSSLIYYALKFIGPNRQILAVDDCYTSDWWEDLGKLDEIGCRKNYLDDYSVSEMLKNTIKRMKPAQIAQIQCRDKTMFAYGSDFEQYKNLTNSAELPEVILMQVRLYNFSEGKNCFNMELQEKIIQSKRKKIIGVKLLKQGEIQKALKVFQTIVSFYGSGQINQQSYDEKISALMNCILCQMKLQNYIQMIKLCDQVLEIPKHGFDINRMKIKGPMHAKIQGKIPEEGSHDQREDANLIQNQIILDKCLYRKAFALTKLGEGEQALQTINLIKNQSEQTLSLRKQAQKLKQNYQKKSVKMYKNMFG